MRKIVYGLCASSLLLLLVGAGCTGSQSTTIQTNTGTNTPAASITVDAAVDSIVKSSDTEQADAALIETDAQAVNADSAELNAYGNASYDLK